MVAEGLMPDPSPHMHRIAVSLEASMTQRSRFFAIFYLILFVVPYAWSGDSIPKAAWKRAIGAPLPNAGTRKPNLTDLIDDGY